MTPDPGDVVAALEGWLRDEVAWKADLATFADNAVEPAARLVANSIETRRPGDAALRLAALAGVEGEQAQNRVAVAFGLVASFAVGAGVDALTAAGHGGAARGRLLDTLTAHTTNVLENLAHERAGGNSQ